jgi:hypothetical protein
MRILRSGILKYGKVIWPKRINRSHNFQKALITLACFVFGGHRKQVILSFRKDVSDSNNFL